VLFADVPEFLLDINCQLSLDSGLNDLWNTDIASPAGSSGRTSIISERSHKRAKGEKKKHKTPTQMF
jgi:hypothetical protein